MTEEHFTKRDLQTAPIIPEPDLNEKSSVALIFKIEKEMAHRVYDEFDDKCINKQPDGSFIVSIIWREDEWVYGTILSYGEYIEVIEPEHIKKIIKNKYLKALKKYL
jgi:predicted DNA-binding transcriptional regulator YafY